MEAIKVTKLNKKFRLPHEKHASLKQALLNMHKRSYEELEVLGDINFSVNKGEFFGIVGRNGSGKSTLLKLLAGIYSPTSGKIEVNGELTPFIELGVGFNPELTGRDNVYLNGTIFGMTKKEINAKYKEIVAFAELEKFMDQKLKNYSSGMQVRLAFSIAIQAQSDILLIDEVLAVGDVKFQRKCLEVFRNLKNSARTIVFVSHDLASIEQFCDRAALVDSGRLVAIGPAQELIMKYRTMMAGGGIRATAEHIGSGEIRISKVEVVVGGKVVEQVPEGAAFEVRISYDAKEPVSNPVFGLSIEIEDTIVAGPNSKEAHAKMGEVSGKGEITVSFKDNPLSPGEYDLTVGCFTEDYTLPYDFVKGAGIFQIIGKERHGIIHLEPTWKTRS